jgi:hypothetical protein
MSRATTFLRLGLVVATLGFAVGCDTSDHGDGRTPFWMDLIMRTDAEARYVFLRGNGSFLAVDTIRFEGELDASQRARMHELFTEERVAVYRQDILPSDNFPDGTEEAPRFRILVRREAGANDGLPMYGSEMLDGYFTEPRSARPETREMLAEIGSLVRTLR